MRIVILDGYTLNPGDLSWDVMLTLGDCVIFDRTAPSEVLGRSALADVLLTNKTPISGASIDALPDLRYIGVLATGYNIVDTEAARKRGIPVTNVPAYSTMSVAQGSPEQRLHRRSRIGCPPGRTAAGDGTPPAGQELFDHSALRLGQHCRQSPAIGRSGGEHKSVSTGGEKKRCQRIAC